MRNEPYNQANHLKKPDTLNLREFGRTLARRKRMILLITLVPLLLAVLLAVFSPPLYRATATLQIERESSKIVNLDAIMSSGDIRDTRDFYQTQFELMNSRALARQVIEKLKFSEKLSGTSLLGQIKALFNQTNADDQQTALETVLLDNLSVEPIKNSRLVAVSYISPDPVQAAEVANAVVETFKEVSDAKRSSAKADIAARLQASVAILKTSMDQAEQNLQQYAREHPQIVVVNAVASIPAEHESQQHQAEFDQIQHQHAAQEKQYATFINNKLPWDERLNALAQDASTAALRTKLKQVDRLKLSYATQPSISTIARITALENEIDAEILNKKNSLNEAIKETQRKVSVLREKINSVKQAQDEILSTYRALQQAFIDDRELYQSSKKRLAELNLAGSVMTSNITVIDTAQTPLKKFKPNLSSNLLFGGFLGLLLGMSAAFMREFLDDTVKDINELERITQLPVLGVVAETGNLNSRHLATATVTKPRSTIAEAFRSLRTNLHLLHQGTDTPITLITSASPNEGKTTTASNLACAYAATGKRVLLIDADLRNPSLHKALGIQASQGLANYLSGALESRDLIQLSDIPNLHVLTAGNLPNDPAELLSSPYMTALLESAKRDFEQIILDAPPVLGLADALILAAQASATVVTVRAEHTRTVVLENALNRLRRAHVPLVGIVLNRVDLNNGYGEDYGGYVYQAEARPKPNAMHKWLTALKKL